MTRKRLVSRHRWAWCGAAGALCFISSSPAAALIGGRASPAEDDAVVLIHATEDGATCSGTMVAPNVLVTALHCVAESGRWDNEAQPVFGCTPEGELSSDPYGAGKVSQLFEPSTLEVYRGEYIDEFPVTTGEQIISSQSQTLCTNDIAFVILKDALSTPLVPIRVNTTTKAGDQATLLGYGRNTEVFNDWHERPRLRLDEQIAMAVGPATRADGPTDARPRTLIFQSPSACFGDSGGPALDAETGALVGVFSQLEGQDCLSPDNRAHYTHLPEYGLLIAQVEEAIGRSLWIEGGENPFVDAPLGADSAELSPGGCGWATGALGLQRWPAAWLVTLLLAAWVRRRARVPKN